jgi:hypothetical protein
MPTITVKRVSRTGRETGSADLHVERDGSVVRVKLGLVIVEVDAAQWDELVAAIRGDGAECRCHRDVGRQFHARTCAVAPGQLLRVSAADLAAVLGA